MTETLDKVLALAAKHARREQGAVQLANFVPGDPNWEEHQHPRGKDGHFIKKGSASFLAGLVKKATYKTPTGKQIDYQLKPGDVAYHSLYGNIAIKHPDGGWTWLPTSSKKEEFAAGDGATSVFQGKVDAGKWTKFDEGHAASGVGPAVEYTSKVGDTLEPKELAFLPVGAQVVGADGDVWTKGGSYKGGYWISTQKTDAYNKPIATGAESMTGQFTVTSLGGEAPTPTPAAPKKTLHLQGVGQHEARSVADLQPGDTVVFNYGYTSTVKSVTKKGSGNYFSVTTVSDKDGKEYTQVKSGSTLMGYRSPEVKAKAQEVVDKLNAKIAAKKAQSTASQAEAEAKIHDTISQLLQTPTQVSGPTLGSKVTAAEGAGSLPIGSEISNANVTFRKTGDNKWFRLGKDTGEPIGFPKTDQSVAGYGASVSKVGSSPEPNAPEPNAPEPPENGPFLGKDDLHALPVGTVIKFSPTAAGSFVKQADGSWPITGNASGSHITADGVLVAANGVEIGNIGESSLKPYVISKPEPATPAPTGPPKAGEEITSVEGFTALPIGTSVKIDNGLGGWEYTKLGDDHWGEKGGLTTPVPDSMMYAPGDWKATVVKLPEGKPEPPPAPEPPKAVPVPVEGKKNKLTAADPNDAADPNGTLTPVEGKKSVTGFAGIVNGYDGFTHPVSGEKFPLEKGDQLLQHKLTPESFAVLDADGNKKYQVNKLGKKYKWSPHIPKSNFKVIYTETVGSTSFDPQTETLPDANDYIKGNTFTHPVSGLKVEIGDDENLMQHNFTPQSYLVMGKDGSMKYKIDVKGKKQKAGTNLKPSNYFKVLEGKPKPDPVDYSKKDYTLASNQQVKDDLNAAVTGDFVVTESYGKLTKLDNGLWTNDNGTPFGANLVKAAMGNTTPPKGTKSDHGVPLNEAELAAWAKAQPSGTTLESSHVEGLTGFKDPNGNWMMQHDGYLDVMDPEWLALYVVSSHGADAKKSLKSAAPPKAKNNKNGIPVNGTEAEMQAWLDAQPVGASLKVEGLTGIHATKTDSGWKNPEGFPKDNLAALITGSWHEMAKDQLSVIAPPVPAPTGTNKHGFPTEDFGEIQSYLDKLPVGSEISYTGASGSSTSAKKTGASTWQSASGLNAGTSEMADHISVAAPSMKETFQVSHTPDTKVGAVAKKVAAKKAPAKPKAPVLTPTKTFTTPAAAEKYFNPPKAYYPNESFYNDLHAAVNGEGYAPSSWSQTDLLDFPYGTDLDTKINALAQPQVAQAITDVMANIDAAKKDKDLGLSPSQKAKLTKTRKKLEYLLDLVTMAQTLDAGDLPEANKVDYSYVWGKKVTWDLDMDALQQAVSKKYNQVKFVKETEGLSFDVYNGTADDYHQWLTDNGHVWGIYLSPVDAKKVTLHYLGAPGQKLYPSQIESLTKAAQSAQFQAQASEAVAAKNGTPFTPAHSKGLGFPPKPDNLNESQWNAVKFALSTDSALDLADVPLPAWATNDASVYQYVPPDAAKSLTLALTSVGNQMMAKSVASYLLKSGIWYDDHLIFENEQGKFALAPGMKVSKDQHGKLWFIPKDYQFGSYNQISYLDTDGTFETGYLYESSLGNHDTLYTAPYKITSADAKKDGQDFTDAQWNGLEALEGHIGPREISGPEAIKLKKIIEGHPINPSQLSPKAQALILHSPEYADLIVYKDTKGHYRVSENAQVQWADFVKTADVSADYDGDTDMSYLGKITDPGDYTAVTAAVKDMSLKQVGMALYALGVSYGAETSEDDIRVLLRNSITTFGNTEDLAPAISVAHVGVSGTLKPLPNLNVGGGRPKVFFADANGEKYMAKPDTAKKFRPDTEHAAAQITKMFGFNAPDTTVREINGEYMVVQHLAPATGDLDGVSWKTMPQDLLVEVMSSHPLDWGISNHDTHGGNFMIAPDGSMLKIDVGQAYKALGSDKLAVGWELPGNFGGVWYNKFYKAVQNKQVSKDLLDTVAVGALKKARQFSTRKDDEFRAQLDFAFQNRTSFPKGMSREQFKDLAMERKHDTFGDFLDFYKKLYADGGYEFPFSAADFESTQLEGSDAHLDVSDQLADSVKANKVWGKSLFFAGTEVEDAHVHLFTSKQGSKTGPDNLHGDMKVQDEGDAKIRAWLATQGATTETVAVVPGKATAGLPDPTNAWSNLVALAKTVSVHSGDGNYTTSTVNAAKTAQANLKILVDSVESHIEKDPLFVSKHGVVFQTGHQQQAWLEWAHDILPKFDATLEAMAKAEKSPKWTQQEPVYKPPDGIDISGKPTKLETLTSPDGALFTKYSDWNFVGPNGPVTEAEYLALQSGDGWTTKAVTTDPEAKITSTQVAHKATFTVTKGPSRVLVTGKFNSGEMEADSSDGILVVGPRSGEQTYSSYEAYEVTSPDYPGVRISYEMRQGRTDANRGRLQFKLDDWDGSSEQMSKVLDMIREMGLDLAPADEKSLELFYWRHMYGALKGRNAANKGKEAQTLTHINTGMSKALTEDQELQLLKDGFAKSMGAENVANADWHPQFSREKPPGYDDEVTGRPHWNRPDMSIADLYKWTNGKLPRRTPYGGSAVKEGHQKLFPGDPSAATDWKSMARVLLTGMVASNEEKAKFNGKFGTGGSATADRGHGSSRVVYLRQNLKLTSTGMLFEPHVMLRTQNYAQGHDTFGDIGDRKSSSKWNPKEIVETGVGGGNEIMLKYSLSVWDDVAVTRMNEKARQKLIAIYKKYGINEIRGIPIEERIVSTQAAQDATMAKVWKIAMDAEKKNTQKVKAAA